MSEHVLSDGTRIRIRPVTPDDGPLLRAAWKHLSPASRHRRFFGGLSSLSDEMVRYLTHVDGKDHIALAAVLDSPDLKSEVGLGVARCFRLKDAPDVAEAAVTIVDAWQGKGLGRLLASSLAEVAHRAGIKRFRGEALEDNVPLRALLSDLGIVPTHTHEGTVVFEVDIQGVGQEPASPLRRWMRAAVSTLEGAVNTLGFLPRPDQER